MKNHFLLLDVYRLIFNEGHSYHDVFITLREILSDLNLLDEFTPWIDDAGTMMIRCIQEHLKQKEQSLEPEII